MSSLKTIAELSQVSPSTVSRILAGKNKRNNEKTKRVVEIARQSGYKKNFIASSMRTGRSYMTGVIISDISHSFYPQIIRGIEDTLTEDGYSMLLKNSLELPEKEATALHNFVERQAEGIIISPIQEDVNEEYFWELKEQGIPLVVIDRHYPYVNSDFVGVDDRHGAHIAVKHLIGLGHKKIGMISGPLNTYTGKERFEGYKDALAEAGIRFKSEYMLEASYTDTFGASVEKTRELLAKSSDITGIFCGTDNFALGALKFLKGINLRVPEDISLVGFADLVEAEFSKPALTTVRQPKYEIGEHAAKLLLKRINETLQGIKRKSEKVILKTELVTRESTGPVRR